jgi:hypothetical protein
MKGADVKYSIPQTTGVQPSEGTERKSCFRWPDAEGESILQLIKIPEHGRHLSTAIERVDHALLLVYQDRILPWRLHAWKYWCWLGSSVGDFGQADGWPMAADGIASSWGMALRVVLHLTSLSTVRPQAASFGQSHFPVRYCSMMPFAPAAAGFPWPAVLETNHNWRRSF